MTKTCTILIGVPASGKSTWIKHHDPMANVMSTDTVIEYVSNIYNMTYNEGFKDLIKFAETVMWKHIQWSVDEGVDFVIDRTNLSQKSRAKYINFLKPYDYQIDAVVFATPSWDEWQRRLNSRPGKNIPQDAIDRMRDSYVPPSNGEGFTNIKYIT